MRQNLYCNKIHCTKKVLCKTIDSTTSYTHSLTSICPRASAPNLKTNSFSIHNVPNEKRTSMTVCGEVTEATKLGGTQRESRLAKDSNIIQCIV